MTAEHLRVLLHCNLDTVAFVEVATALARATCQMRSWTPSGWQVDSAPRGWRHCQQSGAPQQFSKRVVATFPFQYALSTRAGTECVTHVLQTLTDMDDRATTLSVDGIGAYDLILSGLRDMEVQSSCLSSVPFMAVPRKMNLEWSTISSREKGGEQGDALMPMLFRLGQHCAAHLTT